MGRSSMCSIPDCPDSILDVGDGHMRAAQAKWGRLSQDDLTRIRSKHDLITRVQERYSLPHWQAMQDVERWAEAFAQRS